MKTNLKMYLLSPKTAIIWWGWRWFLKRESWYWKKIMPSPVPWHKGYVSRGFGGVSISTLLFTEEFNADLIREGDIVNKLFSNLIYLLERFRNEK